MLTLFFVEKWGYTTTNRQNNIGAEDFDRTKYYPIKGSFTKSFQGFTFKNFGLNTSVPETRVKRATMFGYP